MIQSVLRSGSHVSEQDIAEHMRQTFNYMTGGVAVSGVVAYLTTSSPAMMEIAMKSGIIFMIVWLAFGFFMHKILFNLQPKAALGVFIAFSALTGFSLAPLAYIYTGASIATAFIVAAVMFAGASLYGYVSKKSLSGMGNFLVMGCWGLLAAGIVNIFLGSSGLSFVVSLIAVPLFAGVTAFETNMLKEQYAQYAGDEVLRSRMSIYGAASLYMNFIVMFVHLLQLLGSQRD